MTGAYWFRIIEGEDFVRTLTWLQNDGVTPFDLTGYSAEFHIDLNNTAIITALSPGSITLGGDTGTITIKVPSETILAAAEFSTATYRLLLTGTDDVTFCLLHGQFSIDGRSP